MKVNMETKVVRITPPFARMLLKQNIGNRPIRPSKVEALKLAFMRGEYQTTHQGIAISTAKIILDGQHRLLAIAAMPDTFSVEILITTGLPPSTFDVIDTLTTPRSPSDVLRVPMGVAAVARFIVCKLEDGIRGSRASAVTPASLRPYVEAVQGPYTQLIEYCPSVTKTWSAASIRTAAILRMVGGGDIDYVLLSYHALNHADYSEMAPIVQALNRQQARGTINSQSLDIFCRAFRAFDIRKQGVPSIQITDQTRLLAEAREIVAQRITGVKKAPEISGAKKVNAVNSKATA